MIAGHSWTIARNVLFASLFVGLSQMAGCPTPAGNNNGNSNSNAGDAGKVVSGTMTVAGRERTFVYYAPSSFQTGEERPVVVALHGIAGSGEVFIRDDGWKAAAEAKGFVVVAPDALPQDPDQPLTFSNPRTWQVTQASTGAPTTNPDVLYFDALLGEMSTRLGFSISRVFVVGHSNGGSLAWVLGTERPSNIVALGVVAGHWIGFGPTPNPALPTIFIVGTDDPLAPLAGSDPVTVSDIDFTLQRWAAVQGCDATAPAVVSDDGNLRVEQYGGCNSDIIFRVIKVTGQGHTWPGGVPLLQALFGPATDLLDATDTIWKFFQETGGAAAAVAG